ncbi:MAG: type II secretion system inner membrane protein GspF [Pseudomonadota bacterium]
MPAFSYEALDAAGAPQRGVLQADTPRGARTALRERGLVPRAGEPVTAATPGGGLAPRRRALSTGQLALFARQLATLAAAGLPLEESLAALSEQDAEPRTRAIVAQLRARVMEGRSLAAALGEFPDSFDAVFRASVAAGESSGRLDHALSRLADDAEARESLARSLWMALAYPLLLTAVATAVAGGLLVYVVPQVVSVFQNLRQELPWATRALIAMAGAVRDYGMVALFCVALAAIFGRLALRRDAVRATRDRWLLRVPLAGRLVRAADTARAARTLATLAASGVPVLEAMNLAAATVRNLPMQSALKRAAARVREGGGFARALAESGYFPPVALRLIASGEKSGRLGAMLEQAARAQQREVEGLLGALVAVLGPAVILAVGALVLFIVLAILLPIFELNQLVQ